MFRFGIKVGIAAGTCYLLAVEGVWSESTETTKLYGKICNAVTPLLKQASAQVPIEIPELPSSERISYVSKYYWNTGVTKTFVFLGDLPDHVGNWTSSGFKSIRDNAEMKKFTDSFKIPPAIPPPTSVPEVALVEKK